MNADLVCFARLRLNDGNHRTAELMRRAASDRRVLYVEPPVFGSGAPRVVSTHLKDRLWVLVPHLPEGMPTPRIARVTAALIAREMAALSVERPIIWFTTPSALALSTGIETSMVVYDADVAVSREREHVLLGVANLVVTPDDLAYADKVDEHPNVALVADADDDEGWDEAWLAISAALAARPERRFGSRWPTRDTLNDEELAEATQPVVCPPT